MPRDAWAQNITHRAGSGELGVVSSGGAVGSQVYQRPSGLSKSLAGGFGFSAPAAYRQQQGRLPSGAGRRRSAGLRRLWQLFAELLTVLAYKVDAGFRQIPT